MSETEKFLDYIEQAKSKNTLKSYKVSLMLFEEFYGKSCDEDTIETAARRLKHQIILV